MVGVELKAKRGAGWRFEMRVSSMRMSSKVCTNIKCPAYAHFVYTVAMRCVLCRCDLQPAQRIAEVQASRNASIAEDQSRKSARAHAAR